jgi:hypothetical protein
MRRSQRLLRVAVPLSRFAVLMRRGSASYVRRLCHAIKIYANTTKTDTTIPAFIATVSSGASAAAETTSTTECSQARDYSDE